MNDLLTTNDVAQELGVSRIRVLQLIGEGRLAAEKMGRDWVIKREALAAVKDRKMGRPRKEESRRETKPPPRRSRRGGGKSK